MSALSDTNLMTHIEHWSEIDWIRVKYDVKRLRSRIFQAKLKGKFRELRCLQRLMLKSKSNILLSIRDISYNSGKKTAGIDKKVLDNPKSKLDIFNEISSKGYLGQEPKPSRRIYIQEATKKRPICIPTIYDRVIQTMVKNALEPEWEVVFEKGSYGFRPKRNVDDAINRIWGSLNKSNSREWIVDSDISKCFDSISHEYIIKKINKFVGVNLIKKWLKAGVIIRDIWYQAGDEGTPQGSAISPLLCNISLHGLEQELGVKYLKTGYIDRKGRSLIRFADDLVILCDSKADAEEALKQLELALNIRGLTVSKTKTKIVHISEGFDFLGFNIQMRPKPHISYNRSIAKDHLGNYHIIRENVGIYVSPSKKSMNKIKSKIKEICISNSSNMTSLFILKMNQVIRGYAQSKWHWHSGKAFSQLGYYLYKRCWKWAKRRHPKKGTKWIKDNYFTDFKAFNINEKWVFYAKHGKDNPFYKYMYKFHWFKIRHLSVARSDLLPDNILHKEEYDKLNLRRIKGRPFNLFNKLDRDIVLSQSSMCPVCKDDLFNNEKIHIHHIIPTSEGGRTTFENLVYLHHACHIKIHHPSQFDHYKIFLHNYRKSCPRVSNKSETT